MKLFGDLLPFIGFRDVVYEVPDFKYLDPTIWAQEVFEIEWFGFGVRLLEKEPRPIGPVD